MGNWRKTAAALVAVPMLAALLPAGTAVAADATSGIAPAIGEQNNVLDLAFDGDVQDASPQGNHGTIVGEGSSYVDGAKGQALKLTGKQHVSLGTDASLQPSSLTLSFWLKPDGSMGSGEQLIAWNKAEWYTDGWYLVTTKDNALQISLGPANANKQPYMVTVPVARDEFFPIGEWTNVVVTYDSASKTATFYRNGVKQTTTVTYGYGTDGATGVIGTTGAEKGIGWNGAVYGANSLNAAIDEMKLYNAVATTADVETLVKEGDPGFDAATLAQEALDKAGLPASATGNLTFDALAANGATLTYESDDEAVVSNTGIVTRPAAGEADATVKITVTAAYGSAAVSKTVTLTVPALKDSGGEGEDTEFLKNYLSESDMSNVTVADEYLQNAGRKEIEYLLSFDTDRLLVEFRTQAGLDTKGKKNYGGWERGYGEGTRFTGHFVGHYISAVAEAQRSTFATAEQKAQLAEKLTSMVKGVREAQQAYAKKDAANAGFFPAFKVNAVPNGADGLLVPFYNLHKVEQGMVHAYDYATDEETREAAKDAAVDFAQWIVNWKDAHSGVNMLSTEYGGMNDALYQVAQIADGDDKQTVLKAAHLFDETSLFENLAAGKDVLNGKHANTTIPKLTGAMQRYVTYTEDRDLYDGLSAKEQRNLTDLYLKAAQNFWQMVKDDHSYVNGDNSQSEHFHVAGQLWKDATQNGDPTAGGGYGNNSTSETCNAHNMLKLTRLLFQVTREAKYSEYYEHTFINSILASQNPETGMTTYFQPMKAGYPKVFGTEYGEFWCCQGTGVENFSKLNDSFYFTSGDDVYVNMFRSSTFTDKRHDLIITQTANVPKQDLVTYTVEGEGSANLKLRVPSWTTGATLRVDGRDHALDADEHGWITIPVTGGTAIEYTLPAKLQAVAGNDNANWIAFQYGPVVLAGALADTDPQSNYAYGGVLVRTAAYDAAANAKAAIIPTEGSVSDWLADLDAHVARTDDPSDGGDLAFELRGVEGEAASVKLQPYYTLYQSSYAIYWDMADVDSEAYQQSIVTGKETARDEAMTSDSVTPDQGNNMETTANLQHSDNSSSAAYEGRTYRDAKAGGWFSYDLKVDADAARNYVSAQYNTADVNRSFDVYVDPTPVAGEAMTAGELSGNAVKLTTVTVNDKAGKKAFYWEHYEIPADVVAKVASGSGASGSGASGSATDGKMRVMFKSNGGLVGGVYGVKTLTAVEYSTASALKSLDFTVSGADSGSDVGTSGTLTPAFSDKRTHYTLAVPADAQSVDATFGVRDAGAYVKVDGIVIDETKPRTIALAGDVTTVEVASVAQDHESVTYYAIDIVKEGATVPERSDATVAYDFDDDASTDAGATVGNSGTAGDAMNGSLVNSGAKLVDHDGNGKALQLPGGKHGATAYVAIPSGAVASDQQDLTVSADYAWNGNDSCVYPWALGKSDKDYLVNIVSCGGNTRVEASKGGAQTQLSGTTPQKNHWVHVDVVVKGGRSIAYYLDGTLVRQVSTDLTAADFIGTDAASGYLGLSFYSADKDFGGQVDNFKVWNRALTAAELFNPDAEEPDPDPDPDPDPTPDVVDKSALQAKWDEVKDYVESDYRSGWSEFAAARDAAAAVLADEAATAEQVRDALDALTDAASKLVKADGDGKDDGKDDGASDGKDDGDRKPSKPTRGPVLSRTGVAVLGVGGVMVALAAAGVSLAIARKRHA